MCSAATTSARCSSGWVGDPVTTNTLTDDDLRFLTPPRLGFLTVAPDPASVWPAPRPVWFEHTADRAVQLFSFASAVRVRRIQRTPRASLVVANSIGEAEMWVSIVGRATVETDGAAELARRLAERYWDLGDPALAEALEQMVSAELVRIVITPDRVSRYSG